MKVERPGAPGVISNAFFILGRPAFENAVINSFTIQGISFRSPFCTPGKRMVFVVESHILLESELCELLAQNKLDRDGIQEFAKRIKPRENDH